MMKRKVLATALSLAMVAAVKRRKAVQRMKQ